MKCDKCQNKAWCYDGNHELTLHGCVENNWCCFSPITNADRIRAMTDEELAEFMNCGACPPGKDVSELCHDEDGGSVPDMCNLCWFNWLKQEATDVN